MVMANRRSDCTQFFFSTIEDLLRQPASQALFCIVAGWSCEKATACNLAMQPVELWRQFGSPVLVMFFFFFFFVVFE